MNKQAKIVFSSLAFSLLIGIFLFLFAINPITAQEQDSVLSGYGSGVDPITKMASISQIDNIKRYDVTERKAEIINNFGLGKNIADVSLKSENIVYVIPGNNRKVAEFEIDLKDNKYHNPISKIILKDLNKDNLSITRNIQLKKQVIVGYQSMPHYVQECSEGLLPYENKSGIVCQYTQDGFEEIPITEWHNFDNTLEYGKTRIAIFADVYPGDTIDWIPTIFGADIPEWAVWTDGLNTNLTVAYKMDENDTGAVSSLLNSLNGTRNATMTNSPNWTTGLIYNGTAYDGGNDYGTINNYNFTSGATPKTISLWFNSTTSTNGIYMITGGATGGTGQGWGIGKSYVGADNKVWIFTQGMDVVAPSGVSLHVWHHAVATSNGTFQQLYVDGVNVANGTGSLATSTANSPNIARAFWGSGYWAGKLDELYIWNRQLSASEVSDLYNGGTGIQYVPSSESSAVNITQTAVSPTANQNITMPYQFNVSVTPVKGNLTNSTLQIWNASSYLVYNKTNTLSGNVTNVSNWTISTLTPGSYNYNAYSCASNATAYICSSGTNTSFFVIDQTINVSVALDYPTSNLLIRQNNISINATLGPTNANLTNATLYLWYKNGTIISTSTKTITGNVANSTSWNYNLSNANYTYNVLGCAVNSTNYICNLGTNVSFNINTTSGIWTAELSVGLEAYYKFDENTSTIAMNSPNPNKNLSGTVGWTGAGKINNSITLSTQSMSSSYYFPAETAAKSVSLWVYPTDASTLFQYIFTAGTTSGSGGGFGLGYNYNSSSQQKLYVWNQGSTYDINTNVNATANTWNHVVINDDGAGNRSIYLNGVIIASNTKAYNMSVANPLTVGQSYWGGGHFAGRVDEFGIWNRSLTTDEILYLYNNNEGVTWSNVSASASDNEYPIFFNPTTSQTNNSVFVEGALWQFNISINKTNATAGINFNSVNYSMTNLSSVFNKTFTNLSNGTYNYYYWAYGNGSSHNYNQSVTYSYTIASSTYTPLNISLSVNNPINASTKTNESVIFNVSLTPTNGNLTNATIYLWNSGNTLIYNATNSVSGNGLNYSIWNRNLTDGNYKFNVLGCAVNSTNTLCSFVGNTSFTVNTSAPNCIWYDIWSGPTNVSDIPLNLIVNSNISSSFNTTNWNNLRFYNSADCSGNQLVYGRDYYNSTSAMYWIKFNLTGPNSWNNFSVLIGDITQADGSNETATWSDYKHVYHFAEGSGNNSRDSTISNNSVYAIYSSGSFPVSQQNINWVTSPFGLGLAAKFTPNNSVSGGSGCLISTTNMSSDLIGSSNRAIFAFSQIAGDATDLHGEMVALGYPTPTNYFNLRYGENPVSTASWKLNYNTGEWATGHAVDTSINFHYLEMISGTARWYVNTTSLNSSAYSYSTANAPLQIGGAYGINAPWNGCVAQFNGTIDEVRIANKSFSSSYINRTYQGLNTSTIRLRAYTSASGNNSSSSSNESISILLVSPTNGIYRSNNSVNLSWSITPINLTILNSTLYVWNNVTLLTTFSYTLNTNNSLTPSQLVNNITEGIIRWNLQVSYQNYSGTTYTNWSSNGNYTFTNDLTYPIVNITYPFTNLTSYSFVDPYPITFNFTSYDLNINTCWYSKDSGVTNTTLTCGTNASTTINYGTNNLMYCANDSAGLINCTNKVYSLNLSLNGSSFDYSPNIIGYFKHDYIYGNQLLNSYNGSRNFTMYGSSAILSGVIQNSTNYSYSNNDSGIMQNYLFNNGSKSISLWYKPTTNTSQQVLIDGGSASISNAGWGIVYQYTPGDNKVWLHSQGDDAISNVTLTPGSWAHIVITQNASAYRKIYVNGVWVGSASSNFNIGSSSIRLGHFADGSVGLNGQLDEMYITERELSAAQVLALYNGGSGVPYSLNYIINSETYNSTAYVTTTQNFITNLSFISGVSASSANLIYGSTTYTGSILESGSNTIVSASVPVNYSNLGSNSFYWQLNTNTGQFNLSSNTQTVSNVSFSICSPTNNVSYLNITFLNETLTQERVNASLSAVFAYSLGDGSQSISYSYLNTTANKEYNFCLSPGSERVTGGVNITYYNTESPQRTYTNNEFSYTNSTTNLQLFLLPTNYGLDVTFQVVSPGQTVINGATVNISRTGYGLLGQQTTDSSGAVTFFMNPLVSYYICAVAEGYDQNCFSLTPTSSQYTIQMAATASSGGSSGGGSSSIVRDVRLTVSPSNSTLYSNQTYNFSLYVTSGYYSLQEFGFRLINATGSVIVAVNKTTSAGGYVSYNLNTSNYNYLGMQYYYTVSGINNTYTRGWIIINTEGTQYSIKNFIERVKQYTSDPSDPDGIFGFTINGSNNFTLIIFSFLFILFGTGIATYRYGLNTPGAIMAILFSFVYLFDVIFGWIPQITEAVPHLATIIMALITVILIIREEIS